MIKPLKIKIMEFSGRRCMTADVPGLGVIKAVDDNGKWIFKGRREASPEQRQMVDDQMTEIWEAFRKMVPNLMDCDDCGRVMQEDICLSCNTETPQTQKTLELLSN